MSKDTKNTTDTPRRLRRASLPISSAASGEIDAVAEAFGIQKSEVRERAAELASKAVEEKLRSEVGNDRVAAAQKELDRLRAAVAAGLADPLHSATPGAGEG